MFSLPEEDVEFLATKGVAHKLVSEQAGSNPGVRNGIVFLDVAVPANLREVAPSGLVECTGCQVMVVVPGGYASTKLDSFYTKPHLRRSDGSEPGSTAFPQTLFGEEWQFWSRHLDDKDWRPGVDGISTYLSYIKNELRRA